jgi:hypothetical protein
MSDNKKAPKGCPICGGASDLIDIEHCEDGLISHCYCIEDSCEKHFDLYYVFERWEKP